MNTLKKCKIKLRGYPLLDMGEGGLKLPSLGFKYFLVPLGPKLCTDTFSDIRSVKGKRETRERCNVFIFQYNWVTLCKHKFYNVLLVISIIHAKICLPMQFTINCDH